MPYSAPRCSSGCGDDVLPCFTSVGIDIRMAATTDGWRQGGRQQQHGKSACERPLAARSRSRRGRASATASACKLHVAIDTIIDAARRALTVRATLPSRARAAERHCFTCPACRAISRGRARHHTSSRRPGAPMSIATPWPEENPETWRRTGRGAARRQDHELLYELKMGVEEYKVLCRKPLTARGRRLRIDEDYRVTA